MTPAVEAVSAIRRVIDCPTGLRPLLHCFCLALFLVVTARGENAWEIDARVVDRSCESARISDVPVLFTRRHLKIGLPQYGRAKAELLHDRKAGDCRLVNHRRKSYVKMNTKALVAVGKAARVAGDVLREGVGKLTGKAPVARPALKVEMSERPQVVAGMTCRHYTVRFGGKRVQEIWATSWRQAGVEWADMDALRDLAKAMNQPTLTTFLGLTAGGGYSLTDALLKTGGYPVVFIQYENDKPICHIRLDRPRRAEAGGETFRCPSSYRLKLSAVR
jgi:hypothetical protein